MDASRQREQLKNSWHSNDQSDKVEWINLEKKAEKLAHEIVNDAHLLRMTKGLEIFKAIERDAKGYKMSQHIARDLAMSNSLDRVMGMGY